MHVESITLAPACFLLELDGFSISKVGTVYSNFRKVFVGVNLVGTGGFEMYGNVIIAVHY